MAEVQKAILFGDSLVLAGLERSLAACSTCTMDIQHISMQSPIPDFRSMQASVVIFDFAEVPAEFSLSLIKNQPELTLIGLDSSGDKLMLLSGVQSHEMTASRLVRLIKELHGSHT